MHRTIICFLLFSLVAVSFRVQAAQFEIDTAIKEYQSTLKLNAIIGRWSDGIRHKDIDKALEAFVLSTIDETLIRNRLGESLKKHLTSDEIKVFTNFLQTKEGRSISNKILLIENDVAPVIEEEVNKSIRMYAEKNSLK